MIDKLSYDEITNISNGLKQEVEVLNNLMKDKDAADLKDFIATVEGYSKFLETSVEINKDADKTIEALKSVK